jgi:Fe2+ transport system protein FeoA
MPRTLTQIAPANWARVVGFDTPAIEQQTQLQAYGLIAGRMVRVVQHAPVTVVQIDQTELALEGELADGIQVEAVG